MKYLKRIDEELNDPQMIVIGSAMCIYIINAIQRIIYKRRYLKNELKKLGDFFDNIKTLIGKGYAEIIDYGHLYYIQLPTIKESPSIRIIKDSRKMTISVDGKVSSYIILSNEEFLNFEKIIKESISASKNKQVNKSVDESFEFDEEESDLQDLYSQGADALSRAAELLGVEDNLDIKDEIEQLRKLDTVEAIELIEDIEFIDTEINNLTQSYTDSFEDEEELVEKKKWISDAIKRPGSLRRKLGKKKGEKITMSEIGDQLAKLNSKDKDPKKKGVQLSKRDAGIKKQLNLAKTLKSFKKESLNILTCSDYIKEDKTIKKEDK